MVIKRFNSNSESRSFRIYNISPALTELLSTVDFRKVEYQDEGKIKTSVTLLFKQNQPYPTVIDTDMVFMCFMFLLHKHVYPRINNDWTNIVPVLEMLRGYVFRSYSEDVICKVITDSIMLFDHNENLIVPLEQIAPMIYHKLSIINEEYKQHKLYALSINIFSASRNEKVVIKSDEQVLMEIDQMGLLQDAREYTCDKTTDQIMSDNEKRKTKTRKSSKFPDYITKLNNKSRKIMDEYRQKQESDPNFKGKPPMPTVFMVADIETIPLMPRDYVEEEVPSQQTPNQKGAKKTKNKSKPPKPQHYVYAASFMTVRQGKELFKSDIIHSFSYEFQHTHPNFYDQSELVLHNFFNEIIREGNINKRTPIVYFHNMSKFDGIILLHHLVQHYEVEEWRTRPSMRNNTLYELSVYRRPKKKDGQTSKGYKNLK